MSVPTEQRFWAKVRKGDGRNGCWLWTASKFPLGYGAFRGSPSGNNILAHRYSWATNFGPIPEGLCVCHHCDVKACVRPDHLFLGTQADNVADKVAKGRQARQKGSQHGMAKLNEDQVLAIRRDGRLQRVIAADYGVSIMSISFIKSGKRWGHVALPR